MRTDRFEGKAEAFFTDPAAVLAARAVAQLGLEPVWGEALAPLLEDYIIDRLPEWAAASLLIGGDLTALITRLRIGGQLRIDGTEGETLSEHVDWTDFLWQWRADGCDPDNSCCGRTVYSGADMGLAPIGADVGRVRDQQRLRRRPELPPAVEPARRLQRQPALRRHHRRSQRHPRLLRRPPVHERPVPGHGALLRGLRRRGGLHRQPGVPRHRGRAVLGRAGLGPRLPTLTATGRERS